MNDLVDPLSCNIKFGSQVICVFVALKSLANDSVSVGRWSCFEIILFGFILKETRNHDRLPRPRAWVELCPEASVGALLFLEIEPVLDVATTTSSLFLAPVATPFEFVASVVFAISRLR